MVSLPDRARRALERARAIPVSYVVRELRAPDGRLVVILGEAHMKLAHAAEVGKEVVSAFELRGVETFQRKNVFGGTVLGAVIGWPRIVLRVLSLGAIKGSTITEALTLPDGYTVQIERSRKPTPFGLHVASVYLSSFFIVAFLAMLAPLYAPLLPVFAGIVLAVAFMFQLHLLMLVPAILLRRHTWCWVLHPFLGILTLRDHLMVDGTVMMMADHPRIANAVLVMGRAHVAGVERILVEAHGYTVVG